MSRDEGGHLVNSLMVFLAVVLVGGGGLFFFGVRPVTVVTAVPARAHADLFWKGGSVQLGEDFSLPADVAVGQGISAEQQSRFQDIMREHAAKIGRLKEENSTFTLEEPNTLRVETEPFPEEAQVVATALREALAGVLTAEQLDYLDQNMPCAVQFAYWGAYRETVRFTPVEGKDWCHREHTQAHMNGGSSGSGKGVESISGKRENQRHHEVLRKLQRDREDAGKRPLESGSRAGQNLPQTQTD